MGGVSFSGKIGKLKTLYDLTGRLHMAEEYRYKRVLLKLSGEALAGDLGYGIDPRWSIPWPTRSPSGA